MRFGGLLVCLLLAGCSGSELVRSAESESPDRFRARLPELLASEDPTPEQARDVGRQVLRQEIEAAGGLAGARVLEAAAPCAAAMDEALAARGGQDDELAAVATLLRLEAGQLDPEGLARHVTSPRASWRALGARALVQRAPAPAERDEESLRRGRVADWRRKLCADPVRAVRLAATHAALAARDPADVPALLQTARLDPDATVREAALQALGKLGGAEVVRGLRDGWDQAGANDADRERIVRTWALLGPTEPEARRQLVRTLDVSHGAPAVVAALALLAGATPGGAPEEAAIAAQALARLVRESPTRVRVAAIAGAPVVWPDLLNAVVEARASSDPEVVAAAAERLLTVDAEHQASLLMLRGLVTELGPAADRAADALGRLGDRAVLARLERDARSPSGVERTRAAEGFVAIGERRRALALLADRDAVVRTGAACALVRTGAAFAPGPGRSEEP